MWFFLWGKNAKNPRKKLWGKTSDFFLTFTFFLKLLRHNTDYPSELLKDAQNRLWQSSAKISATKKQKNQQRNKKSEDGKAEDLEADFEEEEFSSPHSEMEIAAIVNEFSKNLAFIEQAVKLNSNLY